MNVEVPNVDPTLIEVEQCRYMSLALAVCREAHCSLESAKSLTPFQAYQTLGAVIYV
jgi:hypothetical protein